MNIVLGLLTKIYALFLRAYHVGFREPFAAEMQTVFKEKLHEAGGKGWRAALTVFLNELRDLPPNIMRENWSLRPAELDGTMDDTYRVPGTWRSALMAGLPHIVYAFCLYLPVFFSVFFETQILRRTVMGIFWLLVIAILLLAWQRNWPLWSASWVGYGLIFLLERLLDLFSSDLLEKLTFVSWFAVLAIILLWLARRDWLGGLLAVLPITPMWFWWVSMDGISGNTGEALLYISVGVIVSLAVFTIVRVGRWQTAVWLILAVILAAGLPVSYGTTYFSNLPPYYRPEPSAMNIVRGVLGNYAAILVFTAPLWLLALWRQAHRWRTSI